MTERGHDPDDALAKLEARGKKRLAKREREGAREASSRARERRRAPERTKAEKAAHRTAHLLAGADRRVVGLQILSAFGPLAAGGGVGFATASAPLGFLAFVTALVVLVALMFAVLRAGLSGAVARERAWLGELPFAVEGWFDVLGEEPAEGRLRAVLAFQGERPPALTLEGLAAKLGGRTAAGRAPAFESPVVEVTSDDADHATNAGYLAWQRRLVREVLLPLHDAYPLASVRLERP